MQVAFLEGKQKETKRTMGRLMISIKRDLYERGKRKKEVKGMVMGKIKKLVEIEDDGSILTAIWKESWRI